MSTEKPVPSDVLDFLAWRSSRTAEWTDSPLDLQQRMDSLPVDEFILVWLYGIRCFTFNEIACSLGISQSTAHARWCRALERMKKDGQ